LEHTVEGADLVLGSSPNTRPVEQPIDELAVSETSGIQELVVTISEEETRRKRLVWFLAAFCLTLSFIIARIAESRTGTGDSDSLSWLLPIGASFALFLPVVAALIASFPSRKLRNAMQALARLGTVRDINELIEVQRSLVGRETSLELRKALTRSLLQVRASDKEIISESSWKELRGILSAIFTGEAGLWKGNRLDFYEAVIKAMEQVGDERVLKSVERIANIGGKSAARQRLRLAAQQCLPALRARVRETTAPETLLRAVVPDSSGELLRPVSGTAAANSELLLRPGERRTDS